MVAYTIYRKCDCTVWPIAVASPVGRCGKCGVRPDRHPDYEDYVAARKLIAELRCQVRDLKAQLDG